MELWLKCKVSPGPFTGEYTVQGVDVRGQAFSLFAREEDVDAEQDRLHVVALDERQGVVLVQLPQDTLENGNTVAVNSRDLSNTKPRELA